MTRQLVLILACCAAMGFSSSACAGLVYAFSWDSADASPSSPFYEVSGIFELDSAVGVGDTFDTSDVLSVSVSVFIDGVLDGGGTYPNTGFNEFEGVRLESSLSFTDFFLDNVSGTSFGFGCALDDCSDGDVNVPRSTGLFGFVTFESQAAAQASFVATRVPEPSTLALLGAGLLGLGVMRKRKVVVQGSFLR